MNWEVAVLTVEISFLYLNLNSFEDGDYQILMQVVLELECRTLCWYVVTWVLPKSLNDRGRLDGSSMYILYLSDRYIVGLNGLLFRDTRSQLNYYTKQLNPY